jgi:hypothetical protein
MCHEDMPEANHSGLVIILRAGFQLHPFLVGGIVWSGEFVGLGSMMVKGMTRSRETTRASGAEIC